MGSKILQNPPPPPHQQCFLNGPLLLEGEFARGGADLYVPDILLNKIDEVDC